MPQVPMNSPVALRKIGNFPSLRSWNRSILSRIFALASLVVRTRKCPGERSSCNLRRWLIRDSGLRGTPANFSTQHVRSRGSFPADAWSSARARRGVGIFYHKTAGWRAFRLEIYDNRQNGDYGNSRQNRVFCRQPRPRGGIEAAREGKIRWVRTSVEGSVAIPASAANAFAFRPGLDGH